MKVALVYDRVNKWGGAERVLLALNELFPESPLYTSVYSKKSAKWAKVFPEVKASFLQKLYYAQENHEKFAFFMPIAFELLDFRDYDLVISVTSEAAKGIITTPHTKHICYCLTPTRYLWSGYDEYISGSLNRIATKPVINYMRQWDKVASQRPDVMIAISTEVKNRIKEYYDRNSEIIYPPVNIPPRKAVERGDNYLLVSRFVKYKKIDLAIKAFNQLNKPLVIVGTGREEKNLKDIAGDNIKFVGVVSDKKLSQLYRESKALIMPQFEDFGLVSVEAQAHGTPVIAYGKGGAIDTVIPGKTGIFFNDHNVESLCAAVHQFENTSFNTDTIRKNAERFSHARFRNELLNLINRNI